MKALFLPLFWQPGHRTSRALGAAEISGGRGGFVFSRACEAEQPSHKFFNTAPSRCYMKAHRSSGLDPGHKVQSLEGWSWWDHEKERFILPFIHLLLLILSLDKSRCRLETLSLLNLSLAVSPLESVHLWNAAYQELDSTTKPTAKQDEDRGILLSSKCSNGVSN